MSDSRADPSEDPSKEGAVLVLNNTPDTPGLDTLTQPTTDASSHKRQIEAVGDVEEPAASKRQHCKLTEVTSTATKEALENTNHNTDVEASHNTNGLDSGSTNTDVNPTKNNAIDNNPAAPIGGHGDDTEKQNGASLNSNGGHSTLTTSGQVVQKLAAVQSGRPSDGVSSPLAVPPSWAEAHEADRTLFKMRNMRQDWLEVCATWRRIAGQEASPTTLAIRYERLRTETQDSLEQDDTAFLAALQEVTADFENQKWQLVSEAMGRRSALGLSKELCKQKYENLLRIAPYATARLTKESSQGQPHPATVQMSGMEVAKALDRAIENSGTGGNPDKATKFPNSGNHILSGTNSVTPGSVLANTITVGDSDATGAYSSAPITHTGSSTTAPRVGSATNRGPERFMSVPQSSSNNAMEKPPKAPNSNSSPLPFQGFGMLKKTAPQVNNASLHYNAHQAPGPLVERMARQQGQAQPLSQQQNNPPQPYMPVSPYYQHPFPQSPVPYGLPFQQGSVPKSFGYQTPYATQQAPSSQQQSPVQSNEVQSQDRPATPPTTMDAPIVKKRSGGRPKKPVTKELLSRMTKSKDLEANRSKPWDVIARELGATATVTEISKALTEANIAHSANDFSVSGLTDGKPLAFPSAATPSTETSAATKQSNSAMTSATLARTPETPAPTGTTQTEDTPSTQRKRGRPRRYLSETLSAAATTPLQTPGSNRRAKDATARANMSAAMKAAWARRKAHETNGSDGGQPSSTINGSSAAAFAAQVLAAAAAQENTPSASDPRPETTDRDEPRDMLTSESTYAQHEDDVSPAPDQGSPKPKKKIRGPYKKKYKSLIEAQLSQLPIAGYPASQVYSLPLPGPNTESPQPGFDPNVSVNDSPRHSCPKCGKAYLQTTGLKWHQIHHPNCDVEPKKRDKRTEIFNAPSTETISTPTATSTAAPTAAGPQISQSTPTSAPTSPPTTAPTATMQPPTSTPAARDSSFGINLPPNWSDDLFK